MRPCDRYLATGRSALHATTRGLEVVSLGQMTACAPHGLCLGGDTLHDQALRIDWSPVAENARQRGSAALVMLLGQMAPRMPQWGSHAEATGGPADDGALTRPSSAPTEGRASRPGHGAGTDPTSARPKQPRDDCGCTACSPEHGERVSSLWYTSSHWRKTDKIGQSVALPSAMSTPHW